MNKTPITMERGRESTEPVYLIHIGRHDASILHLIMSLVGGTHDGIRGTTSRMLFTLQQNRIPVYGVDKDTDTDPTIKQVMSRNAGGIYFF